MKSLSARRGVTVRPLLTIRMISFADLERDALMPDARLDEGLLTSPLRLGDSAPGRPA